MNIYLLTAINLNDNKQYNYIIVADTPEQALKDFNGHDGADTNNQELFLYSTTPTSANISYCETYKLLYSVHGALSNNNAVKKHY
jgi:hypothetical protein